MPVEIRQFICDGVGQVEVAVPFYKEGPMKFLIVLPVPIKDGAIANVPVSIPVPDSHCQTPEMAVAWIEDFFNAELKNEDGEVCKNIHAQIAQQFAEAKTHHDEKMREIVMPKKKLVLN